MPIRRNKQRRFNYTVGVFINSTSSQYADLVATSVTMPTVEYNVPTRYNQSVGQMVLSGTNTYSTFDVMIDLDVAVDGSNPTAQAISELQDMVDSDTDTCEITISQKELLPAGTGGAEETPTYVTRASGCVVQSYKVDDLARGDDSEITRVTFTFQPARVSKIEGPQISG